MNGCHSDAKIIHICLLGGVIRFLTVLKEQSVIFKVMHNLEKNRAGNEVLALTVQLSLHL